MIKWITELLPQCCDFETERDCKDYGCKCCIKCGDDTCSPCVQTGGECRAECRADEHEDKENKCQFYDNGNGCKCCKKCEANPECTDNFGFCVTNPIDCPRGTFPSTGCCGGCFCCKPVMEESEDGACSENGAYCSETDECAAGFWSEFGACFKTVTVQGLESTESGYCCVPKVKAPSRRDFIHQNPNLDGPGRRHPKYLRD